MAPSVSIVFVISRPKVELFFQGFRSQARKDVPLGRWGEGAGESPGAFQVCCPAHAAPSHRVQGPDVNNCP